jgi:hypothetical protein
MAQYTSYDSVGQAEDVSDVISDITPTKTPFQSSIGKETVHAKNPEWQEDSLAAVEDNAEIEGFTASENTMSATTMRSNYTQIFSRTVKVSETADRVKTYGRKSELAYQIAKKGAEAKRNLEHTLVGLDQAAVAGNSGLARRMATAIPQIAASTTNANGGVPRAFAESQVLDVLEKLYNEGGEADILMIKPSDAEVAAGFASASGRTRDLGTGKKVVNAVDLYISPWGEVKIVLNRFIKTTHALLYSPENWKLLVLRDWKRTPLAKTGDNEMHMLVGEFSLKHVNQEASGLIEDLN